MAGIVEKDVCAQCAEEATAHAVDVICSLCAENVSATIDLLVEGYDCNSSDMLMRITSLACQYYNERVID